MDMKLIGKRAAEARKTRGETQREVAQAVGVTREFITVFEAGYRFPSTITLIAIAEHLQVSLDYLVYGAKKGEET